MIKIEIVEVASSYQAILKFWKKTILKSDLFVREGEARNHLLDRLENTLYHCNHEFSEVYESQHQDDFMGVWISQTRDCKKCGLIQYIQ